jgi:hypothetical protein
MAANLIIYGWINGSPGADRFLDPDRQRYAAAMRPIGAAVLGVAFFAAFAACFADLSGFSDGAVAEDAASEAGVATDAAADAPTSPDARDASDAQSRFCESAGVHTLCDDFDTPTNAGWTEFGTYGGGTFAKDTMTFFSPPASLALSTPLVVDGGEAWLFPLKSVPTATTHVHVEAKVQGCGSEGNYVFVSVNSRTATNAYGAIDLGVQPIPGGSETYLSVRHDAYSKSFSLGAALPSTRFTKLVLDTITDKTSGTVQLWIDGVLVVDAKNLPTDQSAAVTKRAVFTGLYSYESPACTARIDDVIIDAN